MKKTRLTLISLLLAVFVFTFFAAGLGGVPAAFAKQKVYTIGYANSGDSDIFDKLKKDTFAQLVKDDKSIKVRFSEANMDQQKQLDQIENFIVQEVDLIIVVAIDYAGVTPGIISANKAGIPVIALGIEAEGGNCIYIGCKNRDAGVMQADYMAKKLPQNAKVLYLSGTPGLYHSVERQEGFYDAMAKQRPDVEILAEMTGEYQRDKAMRVVEDWCQKYDKFDAVVCANDQMALGTIEALRVAKRLDGVLVAGVDATDEAVEKVKLGEMAISIRQSALALTKSCLETAQKLWAGEKVGSQVIVDFEPVTAATVK